MYERLDGCRRGEVSESQPRQPSESVKVLPEHSSVSGVQEPAQLEFIDAFPFVQREPRHAILEHGRDVVDAIVKHDDVGSIACSKLEHQLDQLLREHKAGFAEVRDVDALAWTGDRLKPTGGLSRDGMVVPLKPTPHRGAAEEEHPRAGGTRALGLRRDAPAKTVDGDVPAVKRRVASPV